MNCCKCGQPLPKKSHSTTICRLCLVTEVRTLAKQGKKQNQIAREFGFGRQYISGLLKRYRQRRDEDELL